MEQEAKLESRMADKAMRWALRVHGDQRYGNLPYSYHLRETVEALASWGIAEGHGSWEDSCVAAAWLHDTVEDCGTTEIEIGRFGEVISEAVNLVTDPPGLNRKERKEALYERFALQPDGEAKSIAAVVKFADRAANQKNTIVSENKDKMKMYVREFPAFIGAFGPTVLGSSGRHLALELKAWPLLFEQYINMARMVG